MNGFILALQFLTILPIGSKNASEEQKLPQAIVYFPIVGLILGAALAGINQLLLFAPLNQFLINVVLITSLIIITGGLHLDGLADTFDALASGKNHPEMLKIMRDPHIGTMGVLGLIVIILLKLSLFLTIGTGIKAASLVLMCLLSRYALVFSMFLFPYARQEGKAKVFIKGVNPRIFFWTTTISALGSFALFKSAGLIVFSAMVVFIFLFNKFIVRKIGGITGDTLGAVNELAEVFILLNIIILEGILI